MARGGWANVRNGQPERAAVPGRLDPLADLSGSLRHTRYMSALAIDNAGKPVPREMASTEETVEFSCWHGNGQPAKWLAVLEDWDFDTDDSILGDATLEKIGDDNRARCECALVGLQPKWMAAW